MFIDRSSHSKFESIELGALLLCIDYIAEGEYVVLIFIPLIAKEKIEINSRTMSNETILHSGPLPICEICQISYGFSPADRRSIIVMVVLSGMALVLCYIGVLWYAIRTRFTSPEDLMMKSEHVHTNEAFTNDIQDEVKSITNYTAEPAVIKIENEERF